MTGLALAICLAAAQTSAAQNGMLQPAAPTYTVAATGPTITVPVTRVAGSSGIVGCTYTAVNGTAVAGVDFVAVPANSTLSWADNDSAPKNVVITILNDGVVNGNKTFYVQLSLPTGGAYLGVPPTTPATNHEGRVLGSTPAITVPVDWNTATADGILQTLQILPANNPWNEDITGLAVSPDSAGMISAMGAGTHLHVNRDMNLTIIPGTQATKTVPLSLYGGESDPGPYPVPDNLPIEGYLGDDTFVTSPARNLSQIQQDISPTLGGDRHATILDPGNGYLYEFGNTKRDAGFNWTASGEATFALNSNVTRHPGWTSADAAGLPILPSVTRYDECQRGRVEHAIRFTANSRADDVWPATHWTGSDLSVTLPRMGERFRLKKTAGVDAKIAAMNPHPKAIALALQKYGMILADNGSNWYLSTNSDDRLTNLNDLQTLIGGDFDVVVTTGPHEGPRATSTAAITVTDGGGGGGGDVVPPTVAFTRPTSSTTFSTSSSSVLFGGTAGDNVGVTSVSWINSAGGSGTASGTTTWSALIALRTGTNTITVTAHDAGGNNTSVVMTVTYTPPPPSSGGGGGGGGGGCGLTGLELLPLLLLRRRRK